MTAAPSLSRRHAAGAESARGLLFTVLGEFVLPTGGAAWTSAFIDVLGRLGVEEKATRQALMRTAADGWLAAERVGRRTRVAAHPGGRAAAHRGHRADLRLHRRAPPDWDGRWLLVLARAPETDRAARHLLRTRLTWAGLGSAGAGSVDQPARRAGRRGASGCWPRPACWPSAQVFVAEHAGRGDLAAMVRQAWDLAGIEAGYRGVPGRVRRPRPATRWPGWSSWCTPGAGSRGSTRCCRRRCCRRGGAGAAAALFRRRHAAWSAAAAADWTRLADLTAASHRNSRHHRRSRRRPPSRHRHRRDRRRPPEEPAGPGGRRAGRRGRRAVGRGSGPPGAGALRSATARAEAAGMKVRLAYGRSGLETDFPDDAVVVAPEHRDAAADQRGGAAPGAARAGRRPAAARARPARPDGRDLGVRRHPPAAAAADDPGGARRAGRHRPARGRHRAGRDRHPPRQHARPSCGRCSATETVDRVRIVNHDARDDSIAAAGSARTATACRSGSTGTGCEADVRITTGFVEPHFFAGFSGGPKMVAPGLAGLETVLTLHDARRIGDPRRHAGASPRATRCTTTSGRSPAGTGVDFALDVVLNREQRDRRGVRRRAVRDARGGDRDGPGGGDAAGRPRCSTWSSRRTPAIPLDQNLYQAVKGMSRGRPGGQAGRDDRLRGRVPRRLPGPRLVPRGAVLGAVAGGAARRDRGRAERPCRTSGRCRCRPRSRPGPGSSCAAATSAADQLAAAHLGHTDDVAATVGRDALGAAGPDARVCVLPEGPQTIPYVAA